jgi:hypothetical protein
MSEQIYYTPEEEMRPHMEQAVAPAVLLAAALGLGAVVALLVAHNHEQQKKRHSFSGMVEDRLDQGRDTIKRLEKEYSNLRKKVEEVLEKV